MTAPRGAANEKMRSLRLICGGVRLSDIKVVVRPRAVGPVSSAGNTSSMLTHLCEPRRRGKQQAQDSRFHSDYWLLAQFRPRRRG
jgi:hypothetical protein